MKARIAAPAAPPGPRIRLTTAGGSADKVAFLTGDGISIVEGGVVGPPGVGGAFFGRSGRGFREGHDVANKLRRGESMLWPFAGRRSPCEERVAPPAKGAQVVRAPGTIDCNEVIATTVYP